MTEASESALARVLKDKDWEALLAIADNLESDGDRQAAERVLSLGSLSGSAEATHNLGVFAQETGDLTSAKAHYVRAVQLGAKSSLLNLGRTLENVGDDPGARRAYEELVKDGDVDAMANLGLLSLRLGDLEEARSLLTQAADVEPKFYWQLGDLYKELGRRDLAIQSYEEAIRSGEPRAARDLAKVLNPSQIDRIASLYDTAIQSGAVGAAADYAEYLISRGRREKAERVCIDALESGDEYVPLVYARLLAGTSGGRARALEMYRLAASLGDDVDDEVTALRDA